MGLTQVRPVVAADPQAALVGKRRCRLADRSVIRRGWMVSVVAFEVPS